MFPVYFVSHSSHAFRFINQEARTMGLENAYDLEDQAVVLRENGRYREAAECLRKSLGIRRAVLGAGHPAVESNLRLLSAVNAEVRPRPVRRAA